MSTIGSRLRNLRTLKGLSQNDVAKYLGISRPAYVSYETDRYRPVRRLPELATILGTTVAYILGTETTETKPVPNICSPAQTTITVPLPYSPKALEVARKFDVLDERVQGIIESMVEREYELTMDSKMQEAGVSL